MFFTASEDVPPTFPPGDSIYYLRNRKAIICNRIQITFSDRQHPGMESSGFQGSSAGISERWSRPYVPAQLIPRGSSTVVQVWLTPYASELSAVQSHHDVELHFESYGQYIAS